MPGAGELNAQKNLEMLKRLSAKLRTRGDTKVQMEAPKLAGVLESAVAAVEYWRRLEMETQERLEQEKKYGRKLHGRNMGVAEAACLAERIMIARRRKGMSQGELSMALHRDQSGVSRYENGTRIPSQETIEQIAEVLGCSKDWLLGREKIENT